MPIHHPLWWEASYRDWIGEDENMTTETSALGIHKAICAVKLALASGGGISKGRQAPAGAGGFAFRGIEDFDNVLCGLTAEHNIAGPYPRIISKEIVHGSTAKGGYQCHVFLEVEWTYVCASDGSKHVASTMGEAMDTQDKACNKAMQAARKYADVIVFRIPVGGDDTESVYVPATEGQQAPAPQQQPPPAQAQPSAEKRTRGPNKPKEDLTPAQQAARQAAPPPQQEAPFPDGEGANITGVQELLDRVAGVNTFPVLYAMAQDAEASVSADSPDKAAVFNAIKTRAMHLFGIAPDMKGVQEGFELVTALGQPSDLRSAANKAFAKFRSTPNGAAR